MTNYVKWALSQYDGEAEIVAVEETLSYYYRGDDICPACLFRAKVDLVLGHSDGTLEHIDFKSGRFKSDPVQEVLSRIVVAAAHGERYPVIRTTSLFVAEQKRASTVLERGKCRETWAMIRRTVAEIQSAASWQPSPSPFCGTCPFFGNGCSVVLDGGTSDPISAWLDGEVE